MENLDHVVHIDETNNTLSIFRISNGNPRVLLTKVDLKEFGGHPGKKNFNDLATLLGENILLDSPAARRMFNI